jgi:hypothetical protein
MSFKRLDPEDFLVSSDSIVNTLWSTDTPTLTTFFTSSLQIGSSAGIYYYSVYQTGSLELNAAVQFDIAYADQKEVEVYYIIMLFLNYLLQKLYMANIVL